MRSKTVTVNGLSIETLESEGRGPHVFLCHGNSSAANSFEPLLTGAFGRTFHVVAINFPGHGASSPAEDCSIEALGRLAAAIVRQFQPEQYWLVGQSLGGHALLEALDAFPDARGLALISAPPISLSTFQQAFKPDPTAGCLFKGELGEAEIEMLAACFSEKAAPRAMARLKENIRATAPSFRTALGASLAAGRLRDERDIFAQSRLPVLLLAGTEDKFLNLDYYATLPQRDGRTATAIFEGAGHALHLEEPERFERTLRDFIIS